MKYFKLFFIILFAVTALQAADTTNVAVNYVEFDNAVLYYGPTTFGAAAGTDNCYTQAMDISFIDRQAGAQYPGIQVWFTDGTGTEDANGFVQFSNSVSRATAFGTTDGDLDQIQTTVKKDTIGVSEGAFDGLYWSRYMWLKFDGQTGNPNGSVVNWYILIPKAQNAPKRGCAGVKDTTS